MNIQKAIKKSLKTGKSMMRKDWPFYKKGIYEIRIIPTNGPDCCIIYVLENRKEVRRQRCWNPQAADLVSEEWVLVE